MRGWLKGALLSLGGLALATSFPPGAAAQAPAPVPPTQAGDASSPPAPAPAETPPPAETPVPVEEPPEPPSPPQEPPPLIRRYGDRGTSEISIGFGYSSAAGFLGAGGFRYFVLDGLAPGVEATYVAGGSGYASYGLALASLRAVPVRTQTVALVLTGRAGRMFLADHGDGWAAGAGGGIIFAMGGGAGLELGYQFLRLLPASFCADLGTCYLHGPVIGLRFSF